MSSLFVPLIFAVLEISSPYDSLFVFALNEIVLEPLASSSMLQDNVLPSMLGVMLEEPFTYSVSSKVSVTVIVVFQSPVFDTSIVYSISSPAFTNSVAVFSIDVTGNP